MSAYPLMLDGASLSALVVGGGEVATRKVRSLLDAGASVRVVATEVSPDIAGLASTNPRLEIARGPYERTLIGDALLVIVATNDDGVNATVASDARSLNRLVNVASDRELGNCVTPAVHRSGEVVIAVSAGGVPTAAARIRDKVAGSVDARYATAVDRLASLRRAMLDREMRDRWSDATVALMGPSFCADVESGVLDSRLAEWA